MQQPNSKPHIHSPPPPSHREAPKSVNVESKEELQEQLHCGPSSAFSSGSSNRADFQGGGQHRGPDPAYLNPFDIMRANVEYLEFQWAHMSGQAEALGAPAKDSANAPQNPIVKSPYLANLSPAESLLQPQLERIAADLEVECRSGIMTP